MEFARKLEELEKAKEELVAKRKEEILLLIEKTGCIALENDVLTGALLFTKEATNNNSHRELIAQFKEMAKNSFRKRQPKRTT